MEFLLESIGFPPDTDLRALAHLVSERGHPPATARSQVPVCAATRLSMAGGLELRLDAEASASTGDPAGADLLPGYAAAPLQRVRVERIGRERSPRGAAWIAAELAPPLFGGLPQNPGPRSRLAACSARFELHAQLSDPRPELRRGAVLPLALTGFAVDVSALGRERANARTARSAMGWLAPCRGRGAPRAVVELELDIERVTVLDNPLSGERVDLIEAAVPGGRLPLFTSRWQLAQDRLPVPEPGMRIRGAFWMVARAPA